MEEMENQIKQVYAPIKVSDERYYFTGFMFFYGYTVSFLGIQWKNILPLYNV